MRWSSLSMVVAGIFLTTSIALPAKQTRRQRRCVTSVLRGGLKVVARQGHADYWCMRPTRPRIGVTACVETDARVRSAVDRLTADTLTACAKSPADFGVPNAFEQTVGEAAVVHGLGMLTDLFGDDPDGALIPGWADKAAAYCQAKVMRSTGRVMDAWQQAFVACVTRSLRRGAGDGDALNGCVGVLDRDVGKSFGRLAGTLAGRSASRCEGIDLATAFPGACGGSPDVASCLGRRVACRACRLSATMAALDVDCDLVDDAMDNDSCRFPVSLSGDAIDFTGGSDSRIAGARIAILEHPEREVLTSADGAFLFEDLEEGEEVTLTLDAANYHPIQTGTIRLGAAGATRVTFQAVTYAIYGALAAILGVTPDEDNRCQMVTTVTRVGKSIYDPGAHGEAGVTVRTEPRLPAEHGPIYFNASVIPDPSLSETSEDGGALYIQVPPGEYVWTARKADTMISRIKSKCRAGFLVNASPPWGLQTHAPPPAR